MGVIAVVSDVHANRPALDAVLADATAAGATGVWCLGDTVGYGAEPDAVVGILARAGADPWLAGNHDLVAVGRIDLASFAAHARDAIVWTMEHAHPDTLAMLEPLEPVGRGRAGDRDVALAHGSPRDPVWEYVLSGSAAAAALVDADAPVCFVGHSHVALRATRDDDGQVRAVHAPDGTTLDLADGPVLVNPGSVGQPRDGDPRAAYALLDVDAGRLTFRRVAYDIATAQRRIRSAGLPAMLADRLAVGR